MKQNQLQPHISNPSDPVLWFLGMPTVIRATGETTGGQFGLVEHLTMPPGFASPYHVHHLEDEAFFILEGNLSFVCGGKWFRAGAGAYVFGPREIPHGFRVEGPGPARMLLQCLPAGFEQFVVHVSEPAPDLTLPPPAPDMAKLMELAVKYRIDILGPLPEDPGTPA